MPVGQLEVIFRSPEVTSVAVFDDEAAPRIGLVTRAGLATSLTGRLGYGRAVLERRPASAVTDWSPLVVDPAFPVSEVATRAMARSGEQKYDDVLVQGPHWAYASTAELVRALVGSLAERSTRDPLTRLRTRTFTWDSLTRRCEMVVHSGTRVVVVLLDVSGLGGVNARHGQETGDTVLSELADRLVASLPRGCEAGRVDGDQFAVLATLPPMDDIQAAASAEALRQHVLAALDAPSGAVPTSAWPTLYSSVVWSVRGAANPDELVREAETRLRSVEVRGVRV
ncbi:GGDEF domain-containing protein [Antribacter gilvus]|uniref:GGDEF domain-containing protein n=1 Tax=Antribacter gilvus TaxID=2304675 RepID=UPI000F786DB4|nr:GGDEF domain-containing protein [Antribacter gilvus]